MNDTPSRIGLFGIGLDTYWLQFAGLKERLEGYVARVAQKLARPGARATAGDRHHSRRVREPGH